MKPIRKLISYARVSSGRQRREGEGLERQVALAEAWAKENGLELDDRLNFQDAGKSASKGHHLKQGAALHQILEAATAGLLGTDPILLVEDTSRLSRLEILDGLESIFIPIFRAGVEIVLLEDGSRYNEATINQDQAAMLTLVLKIQAAANYARKLKSYGLSHRAKNRQQILDGKPVCAGWAPSWIELADGQWQLNSYAPTIKRMLELLWQHGSTVTAQTLNKEGHLAPQGGPWSQAQVVRLLENPALFGARRIADPDHATAVKTWRAARAKWEDGPKEEDPPLKPKRSYQLIRDTFPKLLTEEQYGQLKALIAQRRNKPSEKGRRDQIRYVGQMLSTCACGAPIGVRTTKSRHCNDRFTYLFCRGKERGTTDCRRKPIRLEPIHAHLLTRLSSDQLAALVESNAAGSESQTKALLAKEQELNLKLMAAEQELANARTTLKQRAKAGRSVEIYEEAAAEAQELVVALTTDKQAVLAELHQVRASGVSVELEQAVRELLVQFDGGETTVELRRQVNQLLHRLGVSVVLDTDAQRCGLAIGDGPVDWQPLSMDLDAFALARGHTSVTNLNESIAVHGGTDAEVDAVRKALG